jgi:endonuclease YncB( thermonuclease family)
LIRRKVGVVKRGFQILILLVGTIGVGVYGYASFNLIRPPISNNVVAGQKDADGYKVATGTVENVLSGDTVEVRVGDKLETVRLEGLAIPVAMKDKAMEYTKSQIQGKVIELHYLEEKYSPEIRKYGRMAAYIYFKHYLFGGGLLEKGLAIMLTNHDLKENQYTSKYYAAAEQKAKEAGIGIWNIAKDEGSIALEQTVGEVKDTITKTVNDNAPKLTNGLSEKVRDGVNSGMNTIKSIINEGLTK